MNAPGEDSARTARVGKPLYGGDWRASFSEPEMGSVHVPFVLEGELVRIAAAEPKRSSEPLRAELLEVLQPSPDRVAATCRHFGECGGCQYQHLRPEAQIDLKASILLGLLEGAKVAVPPEGVQVHGAEPYGYRNRMRLRVHGGALGYSRRGSHEFLPIAECAIVSPLLWHAVQVLLTITGSEETRWPASTSEVELFATDDDASLQMSLHVEADVPTLDRDAPSAFRSLCNALRAELPELRGAGLLVRAQIPAKSASRRVQERQRVEVVRWGDTAMIHRVDGREYGVTRGAFFQVNRFLTARMVELVLGQRSGELAMDLFAGAGLFSLALTERFSQVIAVEVGEPAATDLTALMQKAGPPHRAERSTTLDFLRRWQHSSADPQSARQRPALVVADPPRAGLGPEVVRELLRLGPRELVYISCDPVTFTRDARALVESGYAATELHLLDLFPQSFHMETIAVFHPR